MTTITLTEEMFSSGKPFAQGEVLFWLKKYAPKAILERLDKGKFKEMELEKGMLIMGHSETGHFHVIEPVDKTIPISKAAQALVDSTNDMIVDLRLMQDCELVHMRTNDNHKSVILPAGEYIRGLREEQTVEGWRRVQD